MCAGHSLHRDDWLKIILGVAAAGTGAGALGYGPLAGIMGAGSGAAGGAAGMSAAELAAAGLLPPAAEGALAAGGPVAGMSGAELAAAGMMNPAAEASMLGMSPNATLGNQLAALKQQYGPMASKLGKGASALKSSGLLGMGQQQPMPMATPPGGGPQVAGMPTSAQIAFPDAFTQAAPNYPLDEILKRRLREQYGIG